MGAPTTIAEFFHFLGFADYEPQPGGVAPDKTWPWPAVQRSSSAEVISAHGKVISRAGSAVGLQSAGGASGPAVTVFGRQVPAWVLFGAVLVVVAWMKRR